MSDDPLHGTTWARTRGDAVAWIRFTDGTANGSDGCNLIGGPYRSADGTWQLGPLRSTRRGCVGDAGDLAAELAPALGEGSRLELDGDVLRVVAGDAIVELRPPASLGVDRRRGRAEPALAGRGAGRSRRALSRQR